MQKTAICFTLCLIAGSTSANEEILEEIFVKGRQVNLVGEAISASEGVIGQNEIKNPTASQSWRCSRAYPRHGCHST